MKLNLDEPLVIAEQGINADGSMKKAIAMIRAARCAGASCIKFQCHVLDDEMLGEEGHGIIPPNANENIYHIIERCEFTEGQDRELKELTESLGMTYLSTPFSRLAADRLERLGVGMFKIGSGECNNYPLVKHIASFGKPVILSTGMNTIDTIRPAVELLKDVPLAVLHCTSEYPTPYADVRLGALQELREAFPDVTVGLSDHSMGIYTALAAVALGAMVVEKHFTLDRNWPGPDNPISILPHELRELVTGAKAIHAALGGSKDILDGEREVSRFAYACVVTTAPIPKGEKITMENIWVKRPGTGEVPAARYADMIGRVVNQDIPADTQMSWSMLE